MELSKQDTEELSISDTNHRQSFLPRFMKKTALYCGVPIVIGSYAVPAIFSFVGFTHIGVAAGSWAASWQATEFLPGAFSVMQSVTATNAVGAVLTKVGIGASLVKSWYDTKKTQNETKAKNKLRIRSKI